MLNTTLKKRDLYLNRMIAFQDKEMIKVMTGIRRCGKSSLMEMIANELRSLGIDESHIVYLNLDERKYRKIKTADQLESVIEEYIQSQGLNYLFIDEIQNVEGFEEVINGFREDGNCSIFITGSNSYLLSGELATKLTGRFMKKSESNLTERRGL